VTQVVGRSLSVCIPTFEPDPAQLAALLGSIRDQHAPDLEVVVVDDASASDVEAMVSPWRARLDLSFSRNPTNLGMTANWNAVVGRSSGALVLLVGQDDVLGSGMIRRYTAELERHPDTVLCGGGEILVDGAGRPLRRRAGATHRSRIFRTHERYELDRDELVALCLRNGQAFGEPSSVMFRRDVFDRVGGYRSRYTHSVDIDFNLRAAALGRAVYLNRPWVQHRVHAANLTRRHHASGASARDRLRLHLDYGPAIDPERLAPARVTLVSFALRDAVRALRRRRWGVARFNLATAWRYRANRPSLYAAHLREIVTGTNLDRR
jgi:GT2 family glycosyltransferase